MKKPYEIIKELESNNSRLFKESVILREMKMGNDAFFEGANFCLLYTSPSPRDKTVSRMPSSA